MRTFFLCALVAFGLAPQDAKAHSADLAASGKTRAVAYDVHGETSSIVQKAFGHCHSGIDCAVAAVTAEPAAIRHVESPTATGLRPPHIARQGSRPVQKPPPPRSFA